ncbi:hypothetical protein [Methylobacterium haplocladii]|uniref:Uncharacterized protein n=1 Tax=Methylobacterium haplocladii TaxID=1176176 RepID=A0A512IQT9_9HYPH|nr:hypothetical protein [Methylobacterium haplocladii]GEP00051.1 hypothetical protein MHA02_24380 [Methylobacterium haplocladii]GJD85298.1 hypothetical protein HPGCJGGD_3186 [Methylobacterium haplocladii]GLS59322.1 hypothetical protein GCM10007887_19880 [Methylobacterium haplocladii]
MQASSQRFLGAGLGKEGQPGARFERSLLRAMPEAARDGKISERDSNGTDPAWRWVSPQVFV